MEIQSVQISGYRNYHKATIKFNKSTLIIGGNDSGKTNLISAIRLLLDKTLPELELEPLPSDFHFDENGKQANKICIDIFFTGIVEDAVLSVLKGNVSDEGECLLRYVADKADLSYALYCGSSADLLNEVNSRFYLKYLNLRYVKSKRDLDRFIALEKKQLLKISQEELEAGDAVEDRKQLKLIERDLNKLNEKVRSLNYVKYATAAVNEELLKLSYDLSSYTVHLDSGAIETQQFIDNLKLGAATSGSKVSLGGDGRNNQILLALWKAKSEREFDPDSEVVFYCVEEPEAHLHPHQQRKLADYLINELPGQVLITTHSPQIAARFSPESIVNIKVKKGRSVAASGGCSKCVSAAWEDFGYRMSILPAEAFFAKSVLLVEGPSEQLFYHKLATALDLDLDFFNISILSVDGISFKVYAKILDAMEIPWTVRTDNDVSDIKVNKVPQRRLDGLNRSLRLAGKPSLPHMKAGTSQRDLITSGLWANISKITNAKGVFISKIDLENDLADEMPSEIKAYAKKKTVAEAVSFLQAKKAIRMRAYLKEYSSALKNIGEGDLARPLLYCVAEAMDA
ncbi:ATP-dependent endonuclease [Pseudomonas sp. NFACC13-1]|uniref:ATP-dependent nuclease n=1 Tax=Pseudomonas sp. NFACC13-1 TaxID=1566245 RepID=UPI00088CFAEC|nr:AAA family ATPase [Pseudomonas sp. NFACC13-1]SDB02188.1 putative ATP-dependent endonuclease of the OLD family [Pseudomonas sp. NFACC13-1]